MSIRNSIAAVTILAWLPLIGQLIVSLNNLHKARRRGKRPSPVVTSKIDLRDNSDGVIDAVLVIRSDIAIRRAYGSYSANMSIPRYRKEPIPFHRDALYPNQPLEELILRFKVIPADEIRKKAAEITVPVFFQYQERTGEKRQCCWKHELKRGESAFRCGDGV